LVRIDPETTGDKTLALITENQQFGVNTTTEIPITIKIIMMYPRLQRFQE